MAHHLIKDVSFLKLFLRFMLIILGYCLAIMSASLFMIYAITTRYIEQTQRLEDAPFIAFMAFLVPLMTLSAVFLPVFGTLIMAELFKFRHIVFYLVMGIILAFMPSLLGMNVDDKSAYDFAHYHDIIPIIAASGAVGGFIYWLIAGRNAGDIYSKRKAIVTDE